MLNDIINIINSRQLANGAFVYHLGDKQGAGEATCWSAIAFHNHTNVDITKPLNWLMQLQNSNGSVSISRTTGNIPIWLTSLFSILMNLVNKPAEGNKAIDFLLNFQPKTYANQPEIQQNNSLKGASWTEEAFSWVEPTAWMLIALKHFNKLNHPRAKEAVKLLSDRFIPKKGWNYGNRNVFSSDLIPFYDITALALIALHGLTDAKDFDTVFHNMENEVLMSNSPYAIILAILCLKKYSLDCSMHTKELKNMLSDKSLLNYCNTVHLSMAYIALSDTEIL